MSFEGPTDDRLAIRELVDSYGDAVCRHDAKAWGANWAEDAVWNLNLPGLPKVEGRAAIVELWVKAMSAYEFVIMSAKPGEIIANGNRATGRFFTWEVTRLKTKEEQRINGRYDDEYTKINGRWFFKTRTYAMLHLQSLGIVKESIWPQIT
jgi:ketosteroid isomerase-like protein